MSKQQIIRLITVLAIGAGIVGCRSHASKMSDYYSDQSMKYTFLMLDDRLSKDQQDSCSRLQKISSDSFSYWVDVWLQEQIQKQNWNLKTGK